MMEFQLDREWRLRPIKGETGKTYIGTRDDDRVFIKRNTTPLLAALSKEGITPKMIWTKRTSDGDTLTAQEWLDGRLLVPEEIEARNDVIDVLYHLHHSPSLLNMLEKIGGKVVTPKQMFTEYEATLPAGLAGNAFLKKVHERLRYSIPVYARKNYTVVHGDVNHRNWLVSRHYLYLVDWDSVMIADPAVDIGTILGHYVPLSGWSKWLLRYGIHATEDNLERIYWYALMNSLQEITRHYNRHDHKQVNQEILQLKRIFSVE